MPKPKQDVDLIQELWRFEIRVEGIYVAVEEIGGQGELGPFVDIAAARLGLVAYLDDKLPDPFQATLSSS